MKRWIIISISLICTLLVAVFTGLHFAQNTLKAKIIEALGPETKVETIQLRWPGVEIIGLQIQAPQSWPTQDTLVTKRIFIIPDLRSLFSSQYRVHSITIDAPYLSLLRTKDGRLHLLPSLFNQTKQKESSPLAISIGKIKFENGVIDFFDASVQSPPLKLRLEQLQTTLSNLQLPQLKERMPLRVKGTLKGINHDGSISIDGWAELADKNSVLNIKLKKVDLVSLQPYLIKASETGVREGTLDLDVKSKVTRSHLQAPGTITLSGLALSSSDNGWGTFMGIPRQMIVSFMKDKNEQIAVNFVLEGNINDPNFSLNENISTRIASAIAESLGLSLKGIAKGVETVGQKSLEAVGKAIGTLFGR